MVTLASVQGSSLVPQFADEVRADLEASFTRKRQATAKVELEKNLAGVFGGQPAEGTAATNDALGILGQLNPEMAQAAEAVRKSNDPKQIEAFRAEIDKGGRQAREMLDLNTHAERKKLIERKFAEAAARGEDTSNLVRLSNMQEGELQLALTKMGVVADSARRVLPSASGGGPLRFFSTPARTRAFAKVAASDPRTAQTLLSARSAELGRDVQVSEGALGREARAREGALSRADVEQDDVPARMGFSKEQTGRFNAAVARGATQQQAISEAVSTGSERTKNVTVDQSIKSLNRGLNRFEKFVTKAGAIVNPFSAEAQTAQTMRRGVQLQLKELFDLGVLNGPDLALMDQILFDPQLSLNPIGDAGVNIPINTEARVKASVTEIKKIIADIAAGRRLPSRFGREDVSQQPALQPNNPILTPGQAASDIRGVPQPPPGFTVVQ